MNAQERYEYWLNSPDVDEGTKAELKAIAGDPVEIEDRFYQELSFGTAGLRGVLGAGDNRMNVYNVRKATEGLARHLQDRFPQGATVAIAYDSRNFSDVFAKETACVLAGHGIHVYLYSTLHSVGHHRQPQPAQVQRVQGLLDHRRPGGPGGGRRHHRPHPGGGGLRHRLHAL